MARITVSTGWIGKKVDSKCNPTDSDNPLNRCNRILSIHDDQQGNLWLGTAGEGLLRFDPVGLQFRSYRFDPDNPKGLSANWIEGIEESQNGDLWILAKGGGLDRLEDQETGTFTHFRQNKGLLTASVTSNLLEDKKGNFWMGHIYGLSMFDPVKEQFHNFDSRDGMIDNKIYSITNNPLTGQFIIGSDEGIQIFNPDLINQNDHQPPLVLTSFKSYRSNDPDGQPITVKGIAQKKEIRLSHDHHLLAFEFAALNYHNTYKNQYAYRLIGLNETWVQLGTERKVTFSNLSPGEYTLQIKGSNDNGIWNEEGLNFKIRITPPWWRTNLAYLIYGLLLILAFYALYRFQLNRRLEQAESKRLKELDAVKNQTVYQYYP